MDATAAPEFDDYDEGKVLYVHGGGLEWGYQRPASPGVAFGTDSQAGLSESEFQTLFEDAHEHLDVLIWSEGSTLLTASITDVHTSGERVYLIVPWDGEIVRTERYSTSWSTDGDITWAKRGPFNIGPYSYYLHESVAVSACLLYTSPSPRDRQKSRMPSSA